METGVLTLFSYILTNSKVKLMPLKSSLKKKDAPCECKGSGKSYSFENI